MIALIDEFDPKPGNEDCRDDLGWRVVGDIRSNDPVESYIHTKYDQTEDRIIGRYGMLRRASVNVCAMSACAGMMHWGFSYFFPLEENLKVLSYVSSGSIGGVILGVAGGLAALATEKILLKRNLQRRNNEIRDYRENILKS